MAYEIPKLFISSQSMLPFQHSKIRIHSIRKDFHHDHKDHKILYEETGEHRSNLAIIDLSGSYHFLDLTNRKSVLKRLLGTLSPLL